MIVWRRRPEFTASWWDGTNQQQVEQEIGMRCRVDDGMLVFPFYGVKIPPNRWVVYQEAEQFTDLGYLSHFSEELFRRKFENAGQDHLIERVDTMERELSRLRSEMMSRTDPRLFSGQ